MTSPHDPFHLEVWLCLRDQTVSLPLLGRFRTDPLEAEVIFELTEFDRVRVRLGAPAGDGATLRLEGWAGAVRAGVTHELTEQGDQETDAYPWYPGTYGLDLTIGEQTWYGKFRVQPRHLAGRDELEALRRDLEDLVTGLSLDVRANRGYLGISDVASGVNLNRLALLESARREVTVALRQIAAEPNQGLDRTYELLPLHRARRLDGKSFRWLAQGGAQRYGGGEAAPRAVLAPRPTAHYDTYENSVVAFILEHFAGQARRLLLRMRRDMAAWEYEVSVARMRGWSDREVAERLEAFRTRLAPAAAELIVQFGQLRRLPFLDSVSPLSEPPRPNQVLQKDPRYRVLFHWYRRLGTAFTALDREDAFHLRAKRTSVLYEYWSLLQVLVIMGAHGFSLRDGWLSGHLRRLNEDRLVPIIPSGMVLALDGPDGAVAELAYDRALPRTAEQAQAADQPFYMAGPHNRPDMRLDLYRGGTYCRSLVFDAKYSRPRRIWNPYEPHETMWQLQGYVYNLFQASASGRRVVGAAIALHPGGGQESGWEEREQGCVILARLAPGFRNERLTAYIGRFLGESAWTP